MPTKQIKVTVSIEQYNQFQQYCRKLSELNPTRNLVTMADVLRGFINGCVPEYAHVPTKSNQQAWPPTTTQFLRATVFRSDDPLICLCGHDVELHSTTVSYDGKYHIGTKHKCSGEDCTCNWFRRPRAENKQYEFGGDLEAELFDEARVERDAIPHYRRNHTGKKTKRSRKNE